MMYKTRSRTMCFKKEVLFAPCPCQTASRCRYRQYAVVAFAYDDDGAFAYDDDDLPIQFHRRHVVHDAYVYIYNNWL
tara:strand:+ start:347 stop:577 length:231 start_codon:yes stop_codon:yes gene_type:complete